MGVLEVLEKLPGMQERLESWTASWEAAFERLRRERFTWLRRPSPGQLYELDHQARAEAGEGFLTELSTFLDELVDAYLAEPLPASRAKARSAVGGSPALLGALWSYASRNVEAIGGPGDGPRLRRALGALSLDDLRTDIRRVDGMLARAREAAERAGLDPAAAFAEVAAASNPGTGGGGAFMARRLREIAGEPGLRRMAAGGADGRSP